MGRVDFSGAVRCLCYEFMTCENSGRGNVVIFTLSAAYFYLLWVWRCCARDVFSIVCCSLEAF